MISGKNQITAYRNGFLRESDLNNYARTIVNTDYAAERVGFDPDVSFNASGVTFEGRQGKLSDAHKQQEAGNRPPIELIPEPDNQYDEYAVKIRMGITPDPKNQTWYEEDVGYVPRCVCQGCGNTVSGKAANGSHCPYCAVELTEDAKSFNKKVGEALAKGKLKYGLLFISKNQEVKRSSLGIKVALKFT